MWIPFYDFIILSTYVTLECLKISNGIKMIPIAKTINKITLNTLLQIVFQSYDYYY